jgi:hypothetical protein
MKSASFVELARTLSREEFVAQFTGLFFMAALEGGVSLEYETRVLGPDAPRPLATAPGALPVGGSAVLIELVKAPGNPYPDRISIGRARNCDVVLRDPSVSKLHAHVRVEGGARVVVDAGSQNGTRVNRTLLAPNTPHRIASGDLVSFGRVTGRVADAAALFDMLRG